MVDFGCQKRFFGQNLKTGRRPKCSTFGIFQDRLKMAPFWPQFPFKMLDFGCRKMRDLKKSKSENFGYPKSLSSQNGIILSSFALGNHRFWVSKNAGRLKMGPLWGSLHTENAPFLGKNTTSQQSKSKELIVGSLKLWISPSLQAHDAEGVMGLG